MSEIKSYCGSNFGAYVRYIEEVREMSNKIKAPYIDPDTTYDDPQSEYYIELEKFLNKQEKTYFKEGERWEYKFEKEKKPEGIKVKKNGETIMVLRSDQLGFSAIHEDTFDNTGYIYYKYLVSCKKLDATWLASCIWNTRTIGGSFIWPKVYRYGTNYNLNRGIHSYIEDRVDLTLLEVKHYYEWLKMRKNESHCFNGDLLHTAVSNKNTRMDKWLEHFKTFENYVDFFALRPFVKKDKDGDGYIPINIVDSNISQNKNVLLKEIERKKVIIKIMDPNKLEEIIDNVNQLITERSKIIQGILEN